VFTIIVVIILIIIQVYKAHGVGMQAESKALAVTRWVKMKVG